MDFTTLTEPLTDWLSQNLIQLAVTAVVVFLYVILDRFSTPKIEEGVDQGRFKDSAAVSAVRAARFITGLVGVLLLAFVWGLEFGSIILFAGTTLTLLGVALFAQWSILSNVTAYFILLLHPSFRRGTFVRIVEMDNYSEGYIADVTLFNTKLITENREVIMYPNNLILGRPALINPRDRLNGVGKLPLPETSKLEQR